jgi:hypothetical protein
MTPLDLAVHEEANRGKKRGWDLRPKQELGCVS